LQILQIFHRKVYPESTILTRNLTKKIRKRCGPEDGGGGTDEPTASPKTTRPRMLSLGCCTKRSFSASPGDSGELNANKSGHWIKTDADCECNTVVVLVFFSQCNNDGACMFLSLLQPPSIVIASLKWTLNS
jgi:hypothetical protein